MQLVAHFLLLRGNIPNYYRSSCLIHDAVTVLSRKCRYYYSDKPMSRELNSAIFCSENSALETTLKIGMVVDVLIEL